MIAKSYDRMVVVPESIGFGIGSPIAVEVQYLNERPMVIDSFFPSPVSARILSHCVEDSVTCVRGLCYA